MAAFNQQNRTVQTQEGNIVLGLSIEKIKWTFLPSTLRFNLISNSQSNNGKHSFTIIKIYFFWDVMINVVGIDRALSIGCYKMWLLDNIWLPGRMSPMICIVVLG